MKGQVQGERMDGEEIETGEQLLGKGILKKLFMDFTWKFGRNIQPSLHLALEMYKIGQLESSYMKVHLAILHKVSNYY